MCMKATSEGCELREELKETKAAVAGLDTRLTKVEHDVTKIRSESAEGFKAGAEAMRQLNTSIANLAHDFGSRMNNIDKRLVEEKEKWGNTLRKMLMWAVRVILAGCAVAMGVTAWKTLVGGTP